MSEGSAHDFTVNIMRHSRGGDNDLCGDGGHNSGKHASQYHGCGECGQEIFSGGREQVFRIGEARKERTPTDAEQDRGCIDRRAPSDGNPHAAFDSLSILGCHVAGDDMGLAGVAQPDPEKPDNRPEKCRDSLASHP